jgi:3-phosphoshikimate 1-carboxyvinyltransferase
VVIALHVPSSKSLTQRALVLAALADAPCLIRAPLCCDDSQTLSRGLAAMGVTIEEAADAWLVSPPSTLKVPAAPLVLGNAGTAVRFLAGLAPLVPGTYTVDGDDAMRKRPMPGLLGALRSLGVRVEEMGLPGCPPVRLDGRAAKGSGARSVTLQAGGSSQELSAPLLSASSMAGGLSIVVGGRLPSLPYVALTLDVLAAFGVHVERVGDAFVVPPGRPHCAEYAVEGDWSSASYPLAAAWLTGKAVEVHNVTEESHQGDRAIVALLEQLRLAGPRTLRLGDTPDLVPTIVACALFARGRTEVREVAHLRLKESDRLAVLTRELRKLGAAVHELEDGLAIEPGPLVDGATLDPARDHRLAMAFGLVSLRLPATVVVERACVSKSYPDFWAMVEQFR